jgi:hypothetical protein
MQRCYHALTMFHYRSRWLCHRSCTKIRIDSLRVHVNIVRVVLGCAIYSVVLTHSAGNSAKTKGEKQLRASWLESQNVRQAPVPPGGWSAHGQPCDAFHNLFRCLRQIRIYVEPQIDSTPSLSCGLDAGSQVVLACHLKGCSAHQRTKTYL